MGRITQEMLDAALAQGRKEGAEAAAGIIDAVTAERDKFKATVDEYRIRMHEMGEKLDAFMAKEAASAKRSFSNAVDNSKGGKWRDNPRAVKTLIGLVVLALLVLAFFLLRPSTAAAQACTPDIPDDLVMVCAKSGRFELRSASANQVMFTGILCGKQV